MYQEIITQIEEKRGFDIKEISLGNHPLYETMIIANGYLPAHIRAIAEHLKKDKVLYCDGLEHGEWVVLDKGFFVIHLLIPELRERYQLERLAEDLAEEEMRSMISVPSR